MNCGVGKIGVFFSLQSSFFLALYMTISVKFRFPTLLIVAAEGGCSKLPSSLSISRQPSLSFLHFTRQTTPRFKRHLLSPLSSSAPSTNTPSPSSRPTHARVSRVASQSFLSPTRPFRSKSTVSCYSQCDTGRSGSQEDIGECSEESSKRYSVQHEWGDREGSTGPVGCSRLGTTEGGSGIRWYSSFLTIVLRESSCTENNAGATRPFAHPALLDPRASLSRRRLGGVEHGGQCR